MRTRTAVPSVTFAVREVEPGTGRLKTHKTQEAVADRLGTKPEACSDYTADCLADVHCHPLFAAVHHAHVGHLPLVLSPDMIWNVILQGLAQHVKNNAERLRPKLVAHAGRKTIEVFRPDFTPGSPENPWAEVIAELSVKVQQHVGEQYVALVPAFSTTGPVERTACEVALLDTFQSFFQLRFYAACGIPEITLEGTPADWDALDRKLDALEPFELDWWIPHLRMIAGQFRRAARGDVNRTFWGNIYKHESYYGTSTVNGWLALLVPYTKNHRTGGFTVRNEVLEYLLDWENGTLPAEPPTEGRRGFRFGPSIEYAGIGTGCLPSGVSRAPFRMISGRGKKVREQSMEFVGGFVGATQHPKSLAIRPKLGWAVVPAEGQADLLDRLREPNHASPLDAAPLEAVFTQWEERSGGRSLPGELMLLYKTLNGVTLPNGWRIRPAAEVEVVPEPPKPADSYRSRKEGVRTDGPAFRFADLPDGSSLAIDVWDTWFRDREDEQYRVFRLAADATVVTGDEPLVGWNLFAVLDAELEKVAHRW